MKTKIMDKTGKEKASIELPEIFATKIRSDILLKVFEAQKGIFRQSYGTMFGAGAGYSASGLIKHRRHVWKGGYGKGISRVPRKIMSRHGASFNWIGATVTSARGGRAAHPPKPAKEYYKKINKKENAIAFGSGLAGTVDSNSIEKKYGEKLNSGFIFSSDVLALKTKEFFGLLKNTLGENTLDKALKNKSLRAGKGKRRGRKYKTSAGLLFVVASKEDMKRAGVDVVKVNKLMIRDLAPNGNAGRLACYTENAIAEIGAKFDEKKKIVKGSKE